MCSSLTKKTQQIKRVRSLFLFSQRPDVLQLLPSLNFWVLLICFVWHEKKIFDIQDLQVKHISCFDFFARRSGMYLFMGTRSWWCIEMVVLVVMYRWWWSTGKKSSCSLEEAASNQTWCLHEELHMICLYFLQKAMILFQILLERYIGSTGQNLINSEEIEWSLLNEARVPEIHWKVSPNDFKWWGVGLLARVIPIPVSTPIHQNVKEIFPTGNARYRLTTRASKGLAPFTYTVKLWKSWGHWPS